MKTCTKCNEEKPFTCFHRRYDRSKDGYRAQCKECRNKTTKIYYHKVMSTESGKNKIRKWAVKRYHNKIEKYRGFGRKASRKRLKNGKVYEYRKARRRNDPVFAIQMRLRSRINNVLRGHSKSASTAELTGCTWKELLDHLQKQFTDGMSWENRHLWHVDHILPCASFDLSKPEEQRKCFHFSNLQPLWAEENMRKGSKIL